jgi:uncharacterized phiE125 gp8 family phage protein
MFKLITSPSVEPVTVTELKSQLRITTTSQDTMLGVLIKAARQHAEDYLRYSIVATTWELYLDSFPKTGEVIWVQKSPIVKDAVATTRFLKYYNTGGVLTTLIEDTDYVVDYNAMPARVYEGYDKAWPDTRDIPNAVVLRFVAGYANAAAVPEQIKQAILMIASTLYENPSDEVTGTQVNAINKNSEWLLRPLRAMRY